MVLFRRVREDPYAALRRRMIRETEIALAVGFQFPERVQRIPVVEVRHGTFTPTFATQFWQKVLELDGTAMEALRQLPTIEDPVTDLVEL